EEVVEVVRGDDGLLVVVCGVLGDAAQLGDLAGRERVHGRVLKRLGGGGGHAASSSSVNRAECSAASIIVASANDSSGSRPWIICAYRRASGMFAIPVAGADA